MYSVVNDDTLLKIAGVLCGEDGIEIIRILKDVDEITVEELAEKTEIQINSVRKALYKLYNHSLVTSRRFRDKDTGWFIFQWRLQPQLIEAFVTGMKQKILRKLRERLSYEVDHMFYHCGNASCPRITFEDAMESVFHCPSCEEPLKPVNNDTIIDFLERKISEIEGELA